MEWTKLPSMSTWTDYSQESQEMSIAKHNWVNLLDLQYHIHRQHLEHLEETQKSSSLQMKLSEINGFINSVIYKDNATNTKHFVVELTAI